MLKILYPFDGENPNEALEEVVSDFVAELGFDLCGDDFEDAGGVNLRVLEFESGEDSSDAMNKAEEAFVTSEDAETLRAVVGSIPLSFAYEPWDDEDEDEAKAPPAPVMEKKLKYLGWCTDGTSDKVWGVISAQREWITFWGGRTKKLTFKRETDYADAAWDSSALDKLIRSKQRKGYRETTMADLNNLDPHFETRFEEELILAMMANHFHQS